MECIFSHLFSVWWAGDADDIHVLSSRIRKKVGEEPHYILASLGWACWLVRLACAVWPGKEDTDPSPPFLSFGATTDNDL